MKNKQRRKKKEKMNFYSDQMSKWQMALFPGSEKNFYKQKKKKPFF
jgi:hypothetical protein